MSDSFLPMLLTLFRPVLLEVSWSMRRSPPGAGADNATCSTRFFNVESALTTVSHGSERRLHGIAPVGSESAGERPRLKRYAAAEMGPQTRNLTRPATRSGVDHGAGGLRGRGEEALGDLAEALLENPLFGQAITKAVGAGERAAQAQRSAMGALNIPSAADVERLEQRLRSLSNRLESLEDRLDDAIDELAALRRRPAEAPVAPDRLGAPGLAAGRLPGVAAEGSGTPPDRGVAEALRAAIERTLEVAGRPARAGSAALPRERATQLLDEVARRGVAARDQLSKRGQGAERRDRPSPAGRPEELANRIESLERRLAELEEALRKSLSLKVRVRDCRAAAS